MNYQDPTKVDSPRGRWSLIDVIFDGGEGDVSIAIGNWDGGRVLAIRWNGHGGGIGSPQSRGLPTWFILPDWLYKSVLSSEKLPAGKIGMAKALLDIS